MSCGILEEKVDSEIQDQVIGIQKFHFFFGIQLEVSILMHT